MKKYVIYVGNVIWRKCDSLDEANDYRARFQQEHPDTDFIVKQEMWF